MVEETKCTRCRCENCEAQMKGGGKVQNVKKNKVKRKPSAYNKHIASEMKAGKSMKESAASWKAKKETK